MRRARPVVVLLAVTLSGGALSFVPACKLLHGGAADGGADSGSDGAPVAASASASDTPASSSSSSSSSSAAPDAASEAPTHAPVVHPAGPPAPGNACSPKDAKDAKETNACAPGGFEELTCAGGVWKVSETCRGPGGCKVDGAGVHCDPGTPRAGDACPAAATPRCGNVHTVFACKSGAWETSLCVPPSKCVPNAKNGVAGCK
jgi:hypothetical protein